MMVEKHHWSLSEVEAMMPWEREVYTTLMMMDAAMKREMMANG